MEEEVVSGVTAMQTESSSTAFLNIPEALSGKRETCFATGPSRIGFNSRGNAIVLQFRFAGVVLRRSGVRRA